MEKKDLLFFYGFECPYCVDAERIVDDLILEGVPIKKLEIWHNEENDKLMENLDVGENACNGIPFFLNQKTGKTICGNAPREEVIAWAKG